MICFKFRIRYRSRALPRLLLALVLLPLIALAALLINRRPANASPAFSSDVINGYRQYYLSKSTYKANLAPEACGAGFHFAAIWEIADPSALRYNPTLGFHSPDGGEGPPVAYQFLQAVIKVSGWVRTGHASFITGIPGQANCTLWNSGVDTDWGTTAQLPSDWTGGAEDIGVWDVGVRTCDSSLRVWCVADDSVFRIRLPLVLMN